MKLQLKSEVQEQLEERHQKFVKRAKKSRSKGKRGEYGVAQELSDWFGVKESFLPQSSSGAGKRIGQPGDIVTPMNFLLCLEIKNVENWNLTQILNSKGRRNTGALQLFWKFWEQCNEACEDYNNKKHDTQIEKSPALIFTKNQEDFFIMIHNYHFLELDLTLPSNNLCLQSDYDNGFFYILTLHEFLSYNPKEKLIK